MTTIAKTKTRELLHPVLAVASIATVASYYQRAGRNIGEVLQFVDGHRASLTYAEIGQLEAELKEQAAETAV